MENQHNLPEELSKEIRRSHFLRAALLAKKLGRPETEVRDLQEKALWQSAALFRNPHALKALAREYGLSRDEVREILLKAAEEKAQQGDDKSLGACYDFQTGKYLTFQEWVGRYVVRDWDKIEKHELATLSPNGTM